MTVHYYETSTAAEIDLVLEALNGETLAIYVKRSTAPKITRGFHSGAEDVKIVIYPGNEVYPLKHNTLAMPYSEFLTQIIQKIR